MFRTVYGSVTSALTQPRVSAGVSNGVHSTRYQSCPSTVRSVSAWTYSPSCRGQLSQSSAVSDASFRMAVSCVRRSPSG